MIQIVRYIVGLSVGCVVLTHFGEGPSFGVVIDVPLWFYRSD